MGRVLEEPICWINSVLWEPRSEVARWTSVGWCRGVSGRQLQWLGALEIEKHRDRVGSSAVGTKLSQQQHRGFRGPAQRLAAVKTPPTDASC